MKTKTLVALSLALMLSGNAVAQSTPRPPSGSFFEQLVQWVEQRRDAFRNRQANRPSHAQVRSVPELDGNMAVLALGLTLAVGGLVREKRRKR